MIDGQNIDSAELDDAPHSSEAEQALLGALMYDNDIFKTIDVSLTPDHFYNPVHGRIFETMASYVQAGNLADAIVLKNAYLKDETLDDIGGVEYLALLLDVRSGAQAAPEYAKLIIELSVRRGMIAQCESTLKDLRDLQPETSVTRRISDHMEAVATMQRSGTGQARFSSTQDAIEALFNPDRPEKVKTGIESLDLMCGLPRGALTILGGRTSMGKSALAIQLAMNVASAGGRVDVFSMEMDKMQIAARAISSFVLDNSLLETELPYYRIYEQTLNLTEKEACQKAKERLPNINFDDTARLTISDIIARVTSHQGQPDLVIIDYLSKVGLNDMDKSLRHDQKLGEVASRLRDFAKRTGCAVVLVCQLNRGSTKREIQVPELTDLRDSGELEQHADVVLFCHRQHYYNKRALEALQAAGETVTDSDWNDLSDMKNKFDLIVAKNRMGKFGKVGLWCDMAHNLIVDRIGI